MMSHLLSHNINSFVLITVAPYQLSMMQWQQLPTYQSLCIYLPTSAGSVQLTSYTLVEMWMLAFVLGVTDVSAFLVAQFSLYVPVFFCILLPSVYLAHNMFVRHGGPWAQPGWTPAIRLSFITLSEGSSGLQHQPLILHQVSASMCHCGVVSGHRYFTENDEFY